MSNSIIEHHINRSNRNLLITAILLFIGCGLITWWIFHYIALVISIAIILIPTIAYAKRKSSPNGHPIIKSISQYGYYKDIIEQIDREAKTNPVEIKYANILFTLNWVLQPKLYGLSIIHRSELVWAYVRSVTTKHYVNFIPTGTTHAHSVIMYSFKPSKKSSLFKIHKTEINVKGEAEANNLLDFILQYSPWIVAGYTEEINKLWSKNTSEILSAVISKRNSFYQKQ